MPPPRALAFDEPLRRVRVLDRVNRFVCRALDIENDRLFDVHVPATGHVFNIDFRRELKTPLYGLVGKTLSPKAKHSHSLHALELETLPGKVEYVGLHQTRINTWVRKLVEDGRLPLLSEDDGGVVVSEPTNFSNAPPEEDEKLKEYLAKSKRRVDASRFDFTIGDDHFVEIKTPLNALRPLNHHLIAEIPKSSTNSKSKRPGERLVFHFLDLARTLENRKAARASLIVVFMYDAPVFRPPAQPRNSIFRKVSKRARDAGLEQYQLNLTFDEFGIDVGSFRKREFVPSKDSVGE